MVAHASSPPPARRAPGPARGVVHTGLPRGTIEHQRALPAADLAPFVAHFWWVSWDLQAPFQVETLPHPTVHVIFRKGPGQARAALQGVPTARFATRLRGRGFVFGIKFRPAAFQPWWGSSMARLTDKTLGLSHVFGQNASDWARHVFAAETHETRMQLCEAFLRTRLSLPPSHASLPAPVCALRDLVEAMALDRTFVRADDAAARLGVDLRTLQRRFQRYVGVGPKWVLRRYRLHEAAEQLKSARPPSLSALAATLGYFDQAHFAREFKEVVGRPPGSFAAEVKAQQGSRSRERAGQRR